MVENDNKTIDICCIGHITHDRIITPEYTVELNGGTSFYFSYALNHMPGIKYKLVTALGNDEMECVMKMRDAGIDVDVLPSRNTVFFENRYGENMNNRRQRVFAKADPFTADNLKDVSARYIHLGSLLADDFDITVLQSLHGKGIISVDAQGFLRMVKGDNVYPCEWANKIEALKYVDVLKVNEHEIVSLTGSSDVKEAATALASWGVQEVLITLGSEGSFIYVDGTLHQIPAYPPRQLVDATGCGDTYAAGYLYSRSQGATVDEAGHFAAAMATLNIERKGPFNGTCEQVLQVMK